MIRVKDIAATIESFAPIELQEGYDNAGLQVGNPEMPVSGALLCLDVTEEVMAEAKARSCNLIISHHPLFFKNIRQLTGANPTQRIAADAIINGIAIYSAHTNLDSAWDGVSHEIANEIGLKELKVLDPRGNSAREGLGVIGDLTPTPALEFLRRLKDIFNVKSLRYTAQTSRLVVRKVAVCGGSGASLIGDAIRAGADAYVSGDLKYHDFTTHAPSIILADIGHYESELCSRKIFSRIIRERYPGMVVYFSEVEKNPIKYL